MRATQFRSKLPAFVLESLRRSAMEMLPRGFDDNDEALEIIAGKLRLVDRTTNAIDFTFEMEA